MTTIGVLALQGAVSEHVTMLEQLGATTKLVLTPQDLEGLAGLIIPGGESTTIKKLLIREAMLEPLKALIAQGLPVFGTCAGMVLLAQSDALAALPATVLRNGFGRQIDSFQTDLAVTGLAAPYPAVFIRAPYYSAVDDAVSVLATIDDTRIVAARYHHLLVTAFHPELTEDSRLHALFLQMVAER